MKNENLVMFSKNKNFTASKNSETGDIEIYDNGKLLMFRWKKEGYLKFSDEEIIKKLTQELDLLEDNLIKRQAKDCTDEPTNLIDELIQAYKNNPTEKTERNIRTLLFFFKKMEYTAKKLYNAKEWIEKIETETGVVLKKSEELF